MLGFENANFYNRFPLLHRSNSIRSAGNNVVFVYSQVFVVAGLKGHLSLAYVDPGENFFGRGAFVFVMRGPEGEKPWNKR